MVPNLPVIHTAERFVVVNKPAGMLSVPGKGPDKQVCAASLVASMFPYASGPLIVHRLDMDTSGLMVFALDEHAQRDLSAQFERRKIEKSYTAVVCGRVPAEAGSIDEPMRLDVERRPIQIIDPDQGRPALTRWRLLSLEPDRSRLELSPVTGRTHQLRVHLAHIGHPILGDVLYGPQPQTARSADRLFLHASYLSFLAPTRGSTVRTHSQPDGDSALRVEFHNAAPF
ncbi:MAG: RluA family pseudouridine synthase [Phycisphaeraceae bacterium]|nr:RluA family pseudouridine synthase [Phycisphaeraceae bacterium]